tara:strand:+ start:244 stop:402 length:159 start_codon:yes stop_codon:yes gene_type:complete
MLSEVVILKINDSVGLATSGIFLFWEAFLRVEHYNNSLIHSHPTVFYGKVLK